MLVIEKTFDGSNPDVLEPFRSMLDAFKEEPDVNVKSLLAQAFNAFCEQFQLNGCTAIESDTSYQEARKVLDMAALINTFCAMGGLLRFGVKRWFFALLISIIRIVPVCKNGLSNGPGFVLTRC